MLHDPLDLRGQERDAHARTERDKLTHENEGVDLRWLMSNKRGRRIVWRLLDQSGVFRLSFNSNAMTMAFAEGNRNFGNRTLSMIHTLCPEQYAVMVKESIHERDHPDRPVNDHA
jgi:hypothetical protein